MTQQTIYLVRHGETVWNRERRLQGQQDSPLTDKGREQARRVGLLLRELIDNPEQYPIHASPLARTRDTAAIVSRALGLEPDGLLVDDLLKEIRFGAWEGMTFDEVAAADPDNWRRFREDRWNFVPPDGESYAIMAQRSRRWLSGISAQPSAIAVAHGEFGRVLRGTYSGLSPDDMFSMDVPQDAIFRLSGGTVARIET